jgi:hypothetical protein
MEAHSESPSEGLWGDIERAIDRAAAARVRRRRVLYWGSGTAAAAVVTALFFLLGDVGGGSGVGGGSAAGGVLSSVVGEYRTPEAEPVPAPESLPAPAPESVPAPEYLPGPVPEFAPEPTPESAPAPKPAPASSRDAGDINPVTGREPLPEDTPATENPEASGGSEAHPVPEQTRPAKEAPQPARQDARPASESSRPARQDARPRDNFMARDEGRTTPEPPKRRRWQAGLYASNLSPAGSSSSNDRSVASSPEFLSPGELIWDHSYGADYLGLDATSGMLKNHPLYTDLTHRLPVTVGLSVSRGLGGRWSLASGVTWTMLSSRSQAIGSSIKESRRQVLHYIGIPLDVSYDVWSGRRLSVYLSAGGQMEKSVAGSETFTRHAGGADGADGVDASNTQEWKKSLSDRMQWSIRGSAGVQFHLTGRAGLYAEPGVNYYFDNRSAIETVYKVKPLNFGLRLGLRFSL